MPSSGWRSRLLFAPFVVLYVALFGRVLLAPSGSAPATQDADFYLYYFPMTEMAFRTWREHGFPLWNPYLYSGMPMLLSMEVGLLYPPNWLHLVLSTERAFCILYPLHILLAAGGATMYVCGRGGSNAAALLSATAYAFAAPTILHFEMGLTSVVYSSAWVPLIFALIDRVLKYRNFPAIAWLSFALACQFLAGFPMFTLLLAAWIPAYLLCFGISWRMPLSFNNLHLLIVFGAAALLALGLVLPQLWPAWEHLQHVHRGELGYDQATHCSFPAANVATLLSPRCLGTERSCPYWGESMLYDANAYCGATTLLLACFAGFRWRSREILFWAISTAVVIGLALGKDSPFYDLCFLTVPGVDRFRGIGRLMIFADMGLAILAGMGLDVVLATTHRRRQFRLSAILAAGAAVVLVAAVYFWCSDTAAPAWWEAFFEWARRPGRELNTQFIGEARRAILDNGYALVQKDVAACMAIILVECALIAISQRWSCRQSLATVLLMALSAELYGFDSEYARVMETARWRQVSQQVQAALPADSEPYRVAAFSSNPPIMPNRLLYGPVESVGGHENFVLERYSLFLYKCLGIQPTWQTYLAVPNKSSIYNALNVKYYLKLDDGRYVSSDEVVCPIAMWLHGRAFALYRNRGALPRAFLMHDVQPVESLEAAARSVSQLVERGFRDVVFIEGNPGIAIQPVAESERHLERVSITNYAPGRLVVDVHSRAAALLVFIENYDAGWQATVDGRRAAVLPANLFMTAVPIEAGDHQVRLTYEPVQFVWGLLLAAASLLILIGGCCVSFLRRRVAVAR